VHKLHGLINSAIPTIPSLIFGYCIISKAGEVNKPGISSGTSTVASYLLISIIDPPPCQGTGNRAVAMSVVGYDGGHRRGVASPSSEARRMMPTCSVDIIFAQRRVKECC